MSQREKSNDPTLRSSTCSTCVSSSLGPGASNSLKDSCARNWAEANKCTKKSVYNLLSILMYIIYAYYGILFAAFFLNVHVTWTLWLVVCWHRYSHLIGLQHWGFTWHQVLWSNEEIGKEWSRRSPTHIQGFDWFWYNSWYVANVVYIQPHACRNFILHIHNIYMTHVQKLLYTANFVASAITTLQQETTHSQSQEGKEGKPATDVMGKWGKGPRTWNMPRKTIHHQEQAIAGFIII